MHKVTRNNVYYDLSITPFVCCVAGVKYYFSSASHLDKFMSKWGENRKRIADSLSSRFKLNVSLKRLADITLYSKIETRGFRIEYEGSAIECPEDLELSGERLIIKK